MTDEKGWQGVKAEAYKVDLLVENKDRYEKGWQGVKAEAYKVDAPQYLFVENKDRYEMMLDQAALYMKSGFAPEYLKSPGAVLAALETGRELGLSPMQSLRTVRVAKGVTSLDAHLMLGLAIKAGVEIVDMTVSDTKCEVVAKHPKMYGGKSRKFAYSIEQAKAAGLLSKDPAYNPWLKFPQDMLYATCIRKMSKQLAPWAMFGMEPSVHGMVETFEDATDTVETVAVEQKPALEPRQETRPSTLESSLAVRFPEKPKDEPKSAKAASLTAKLEAEKKKFTATRDDVLELAALDTDIDEIVLADIYHNLAGVSEEQATEEHHGIVWNYLNTSLSRSIEPARHEQLGKDIEACVRKELNLPSGEIVPVKDLSAWLQKACGKSTMKQGITRREYFKCMLALKLAALPTLPFVPVDDTEEGKA